MFGDVVGKPVAAAAAASEAIRARFVRYGQPSESLHRAVWSTQRTFVCGARLCVRFAYLG